MPALVLCGWRWRVSTDDFVFPAAGAAFGRVLWVVCIAVVHTRLPKSVGCVRHDALLVFLEVKCARTA